MSHLLIKPLQLSSALRKKRDYFLKESSAAVLWTIEENVVGGLGKLDHANLRRMHQVFR
jgi:hypothetical protein